MVHGLAQNLNQPVREKFISITKIQISILSTWRNPSVSKNRCKKSSANIEKLFSKLKRYSLKFFK